MTGVGARQRVRDVLTRVYEHRLARALETAEIPRHVGVIIDGNRRWARDMGLEDISEGLEGTAVLSDDNAELLVALDAALTKLALVNERQSRIVECRFFGGLTIDETAAALGISTASVSRGWALAQVRLFHDVQRELEG